jgi:large subunit ribosomal protein L32
VALPKRRHSKTRGRKRRTHWKIAALNLSACPECKQPRTSHQVCPVCGSYDGKQVVVIETEDKKKKKKKQ